MTTTTDYGTWCTIVDRYSTNLETTILDGYFGSEGAEGFDFESIAADYHNAINDALPSGVALTSDQFIGPAYAEDQNFDGYPADECGSLDIKAIVDSVDLDAIVKRHQLPA